MNRMLYAKKSLGQHFLKDENIARQIVSEFLTSAQLNTVVEVGPGQGVLTKYLLAQPGMNYFGVELDHRMIPVLLEQFPQMDNRIFNEDILNFDFLKTGTNTISLI